MTLQLAVIADDLTGGADTGVLFCPAVGPLYMTGVEDGRLDLSRLRPEGLVVCTNSRHLVPAAAEKAASEAAAGLKALNPALVYKKIDSCLRGNPGTEIDVLLRELGGKLSFIAPAFPSQERTTEGDIHKVHGVPVAETEAGRDPMSPVTTSRLSERIAEKSRLAVGHLGLDILESGNEKAARHVRALQLKGCSHIVFDAVTDSHLDLIVALRQEQFSDEAVLLAGSAGLAKALVRTMAGTGRTPARPAIHKWLFVCGSASRVTSKQAAELAAYSGWPHRILDASFLAEPANIAIAKKAVERAVSAWQKSSLILSIAPLQEENGVTNDPAQVISGMAEMAALLISATVPQGIFLSGGDTAEAVLRRIGAKGLFLFEEILPGLMLGAIEGGLCDKVPIVTKAGAFGPEDILKHLVTSLK